jgi:prepilin-type N-terminal cleavage/methylation domain-containing protein
MIECRSTASRQLGQRGFTLIELVIIIVVLGIIAGFAVPRFSDLASNSKETATLDEMNSLKKAIIGNPAALAGGEYIDRGFEGDVGYPPTNLLDLAAKPDSLAAYNKLTRLGWNGPYVDSSGGAYLADAWGTTYIYDRIGRRIVSAGGPDSLIVNF